MANIDSYGLIDNPGNIVDSSNDFSVAKNSPGKYWLRFNRNVHDATVVATARNLKYCDSNGTTMEVCNPIDKPDTIGISFDDQVDVLGFSFMLIDSCRARKDSPSA